ncbi:hypothetical protein [Pseudomonas fontis]|uniref:Uncharacterized protein n=1 Tax=Pseudomonas fontis TaxID=2942633 RepID=A0ABT5NLL9_9PSED|nr:hypothetical protein [Pseudomonas fontis]MDD0975757.1 hypothetical protein [Pseudomonas fontis]MDD0989430.1 hypothetical protein [Pseudomonas fontis]
MPTKNRSSNTEQMVSFPSELTDDLAELIAEKVRVCGGGAVEIWDTICAHAQPTTQHQGEPVAIVDEGDDGVFIDFIYGENGNPLQRGDQLYTHADAGEVERLRAEGKALTEKYEASRDRKNSMTALKIENEQLKEDLVVFKGGISALGEASRRLMFCALTTGGTAGPDQGLMDACDAVEKSQSLVGVSRAIDYIEGLIAERDTLRAHLAERDALLHRASRLGMFTLGSALYEEICKTLSASAEPSAPADVALPDRSPEDYAIEHAEYMAKSADDVMAKFQAYGLALLAVDEGGDDGEGELFEAIDTARDDLQESLVDLRSMVYEFRKRCPRPGL